MSRTSGIALPCFVEPLLRVLSHRLHQPVALAIGLHGDKRFVDQVRQEIEYIALRYVAAGTHGFRGVERPAPRKDREPAQQRALVFRQQVVAPVDQRAQRLLARHRSAVSSCQKAETVRESRGDRLDGQGAHARGSEFERQRNSIQPLTYVGHRCGVLLGELECRLRRDRPIDEQQHGLVLRERRKPDRLSRIGNRKRGNRIARLTCDAQWLAA